MIVYTILIVLIAFIGVLMGVVVLLQSGKGSGLAGIAGGGSGATQLLGARQAPDILEKATWVLATIFIVLCIMTNFFIGAEQRQSVIQSQTQTQEAPIQTPAPVLPAPTENPAPAPSQDTPPE